MKLNHSQYTVAEIIEKLKRKDVIINREYQRSSGIWPTKVQSYFIDTILEGFPFPKLYFYQTYDEYKRKPIMEVVDGQQRINTIKRFIENNLRLTTSSERYAMYKYEDLNEEEQYNFLLYSVPVDVILAADKSSLLEMFRRMNAYTAPLNSAEKRHSEFQGEFKWFINDMADKFSPTLEEFKILTPKQLVRMADSELLSEFSLVIEKGITHKSASRIRNLYKQFDEDFPGLQYHKEILENFFHILTQDFSSLRNTFIMKDYVIHSLFAAITHLKYGIPNGDQDLEIQPIGKSYESLASALVNLQVLADEHETKNLNGPYKEYVSACISTTTKRNQRLIRTKYIIDALIH